MTREILLVDDDRLLVKTLSAVLAEAGYSVRTAANGAKAVEAVALRRPDLVLLDVMMPRKNGLEVCRELRKSNADLPVLFLTSLETTDDEIACLTAGGDGFIPKTAPDEILLARVAAALRSRKLREHDAADFEFGSWKVLPNALQLLSRSGRTVNLTERELFLLRLFSDHPQEVFTRDALLTRLFGATADPRDNALNLMIHELRKKLGSAANAIKAIYGVGYAYRP